MRYYILNQKNQPEGPFSWENLQSGIKNKNLTPESLVCLEGGAEWVTLASIISQDKVEANSKKPARNFSKHLFGAGVVVGMLLAFAGMSIISSLKPRNTNDIKVGNPTETETINTSEPVYISRVLHRSGGIDGIRIILRFNDDRDRDTTATGKVEVKIHDKLKYETLAEETFDISPADFKNTEYGAWEALMITLPRIKYRRPIYPLEDGQVYGDAKVLFTSAKGVKIKGEGSVALKP